MFACRVLTIFYLSRLQSDWLPLVSLTWDYSCASEEEACQSLQFLASLTTLTYLCLRDIDYQGGGEVLQSLTQLREISISDCFHFGAGHVCSWSIPLSKGTVHQQHIWSTHSALSLWHREAEVVKSKSCYPKHQHSQAALRAPCCVTRLACRRSAAVESRWREQGLCCLAEDLQLHRIGRKRWSLPCRARSHLSLQLPFIIFCPNFCKILRITFIYSTNVFLMPLATTAHTHTILHKGHLSTSSCQAWQLADLGKEIQRLRHYQISKLLKWKLTCYSKGKYLRILSPTHMQSRILALQGVASPTSALDLMLIQI